MPSFWAASVRLPLLSARARRTRESLVSPRWSGRGARGRKVDLDDIEAEEEVLAEFAFGHHFGEVAVGRGEEAHLGGDGFVAADALEDAFAEDTEDFHLGRGVDLPDFVEEEGAPGGLFESSDAPLARSGERTFLMPEKFALEQLRRKCGAMHRDKRCAMARAEPVDGLCGQFFPGAALAGN